MAEAIGVVPILHTDSLHASVKRRIILGGNVLCRIDLDSRGSYPYCLRPASVVLLADYNWGVLDGDMMKRIALRYAGQEIIADWHPSRPLDFYRCATALKASWDAPHDDRPFIRTMGAEGMLLKVDGQLTNFPAQVQEPLDPCGAGDAVLAALGVGRLRGWDWHRCCMFASEVAAKVCKTWGSVYELGSGTREL